MSWTCFEVSIEGRVAHIRLNRPDKRNAMNQAFWDELPAIIDDIDANAKARVIVISSTGPHFSSGLDITDFNESPPTGKDARVGKIAWYHRTRLMQETFSCLERCRVPVIAAIQGGAIGGGVDMITACDLRFAAEDAFITIFEINVGMTADVGTFPRILNLLPEGIVRELAYTGRRMGAAEAHRLGLFNDVLPSQEAAVAKALEVAREIASKSPQAVYGCKKAITWARDHNTEDGLEQILLWNAHALNGEEVMAAMVARSQKKDGDFAELPPIPRKVKKK